LRIKIASNTIKSWYPTSISSNSYTDAVINGDFVDVR